MSPHPRTTELSRDQVTEIRRDTEVEERPKHFDLSLSKILAGALAAASAAVAASWMGVAGTVLGAVVASVVVSVSTSLYHRPLQRSTEVLRQTIPLPAERYRAFGADSTSETMVLDPRAGDDAPVTQTEIRETVVAPAGKRRIQWTTVLVSSMLTLVVGFGMLTAVEAFLGHSVSGEGGSTITKVIERDSGAGTDNGTPSKPSQSTPTDDQPTQTEPTQTEPTDSEPTEPEPTEPTETDPTQTEPTPTEPTATDPGAADDGAADDTPTGDASTTLDSTTL